MGWTAPQYGQGVGPAYRAYEMLQGRGNVFGQRGGGSRSAQEDALALQMSAATGGQPSVAEEQLRAGTAQNVADQLALQAKGRGGNLAATQRAASSAGAGAGAELGAAQAALRGAEMASARQGLGDLSTAMQAQDIEGQLGYEGLLSQAQQAQLGANTSWGIAQDQLALEGEKFEWGKMMDWIGLMRDVGSGIMMSDRRLKKDVEAAPAAAREDLADLGSYSFRYRDGAGPPGRKIGVMAQDLAEHATTSGAVVPTDRGLAVDVGSLVSFLGAMTADQERRLQRLEGSGGNRKSTRSAP